MAIIFFLRQFALRRHSRILLLVAIAWLLIINTSISFRPLDNRLSLDFRTYILPPHRPLQAPIHPLSPTANFITPAHLDTWTSAGLLPVFFSSFTDLQLDVLYTWVNGSDQRLRKHRRPFDHIVNNLMDWNAPPICHPASAAPRQRTQEVPTTKGIRAEKRYRDNDELRYSVRGVERNVPFARKITIVSADFPVPRHAAVRETQVPQWLLPSALDSVPERIRMVHHSTIFNKLHLPTFNSLAIESRIVDVPDVLPVVLYLNDDTFVAARTTIADFYTPLFGLVVHTHSGLWVEPVRRGRNPHEGAARFGRRPRAYVSHIHHTLSPPILRELQLEWPHELAQTSSNSFPGSDWEVHTPFLFTHYVIERHREALLHSYLALRIDADGDGLWSWSERTAVLGLVHKWQNGGEGVFRAPPRETMNMAKERLARAGIEAATATEYLWASADGFAFSRNAYGAAGKVMAEGDAQYEPEVHRVEERMCSINVTRCFPSGFEDPLVSAVRADWRKVAFEDVACGDCLVMMLVAESGQAGLEAFLPPKDDGVVARNGNRVKKDKWDPITLIPNRDTSSDKLASSYKPISPISLVSPQTPSFLNPFATSSPTTPRQRAIARIHRYSYMIGRSRHTFVSLQSADAARVDLQNLLSSRPDAAGSDKEVTAFFCLSDDLDSPAEGELEKMRVYIKEFLEAWFPGRSSYERWGSDVEGVPGPENTGLGEGEMLLEEIRGGV
ncbi:hypothetical protein BC936DRAFT_141504 [Jimgerdemannia flammicorona]|uniref:Stealth protein CR3 conserved region 3 domain-containing protein n=1 Tax=Jimgerdemannia flammicorona TaxID=994334 RepID=A0A433DG10_9FUNG|nr:hypothetical protein BC936DRAFT_141504 [Jimgerdemannia flammicorona]